MQHQEEVRKSETTKPSTAKDEQKRVQGGSVTKVFEDPGL